MDTKHERRAFPRLVTGLSVDCRRLDEPTPSTCRAVTRDVGSGGVYLETQAAGFVPGSRWAFTLAVPPGEGHFPYAGRVHCVGNVCRVESLTVAGDDPSADSIERHGVAISFEQPLKLVFEHQ
ncbi:MAG: hypothetical protein ACE5GE_02465 [Phycisphaerae bacterium]